MSNYESLNAFNKRLERLDISAALKEKYEQEYKRLLYLRSDDPKRVAEHASHISFACFCKGTTRINSELKLIKALAAGESVELRLFSGIGADANLLSLLDNSNVTTPKLRPLTKIRVWQEANAKDLPVLTLREIITQMPRCLVKKARAVCLLSEEDNIPLNAYNNLMGMFEYNIWLFE